MKTQPDLRQRRAKKDRSTLLTAVIVLALIGAAGWWVSRDVRKKHDEVLATVPAFPTKEAPPKETRRPADPIVQATPAPANPAEPPKPRPPDAVTRFVMHPSKAVGVIEVNAIVNTPFFERIKECYAPEGKNPGAFDFLNNVDRIAMSDDGLLWSGFFEDKDVAAEYAGQQPDARRREYRGFTITELPQRIAEGTTLTSAVAQKGSIVLWGQTGTINRMIDRALDPPPADADASDIYGDVYFRSTMDELKSGLMDGDRPNDAISSILDRLDGMTLRANIWDSVALTLDGVPKNGQSIEGLASIVRGGLALAKNQVDDDDVRLSALAELANVDTDDKQIKMKLAVPVQDLFEKFRFPCPAKDPKPAPAEASIDAPAVPQEPRVE